MVKSVKSKTEKPVAKHWLIINRLPIIGGVFLLVIAVGISFGFWLYSSPASKSKIAIFNKTNLPVAKVGSHYIGGRELFSRYDMAVQIYGEDKSFDTAQAKIDILDRLAEVEKLIILAEAKNLSMSTDEVDKEYARIAEQEGGQENFQNLLQEKYQFSPEYFKQKALEPDLLKVKLAIAFYKDKGLNPKLYETLEVVESKLKKGVPFEELARTYSEDPATRQFGGDSGQIPINNLAPELKEIILNTEPGKTITVPTRFGVYIIRILSIKQDDLESGSVHFQSILFNLGKIDSKANESAFIKWYNSEVSKIKYKKFINL